MNINQKILKNINNNYELKENLSDYSARLLSGYNDYSNVKLALEYINLHESILEFNESFIAVDKSLDGLNPMEIINNAVKEAIVGSLDEEGTNEQLNKVLELRSTLITLMDYILLATSKLSKIEYILNRIEYRFADELPKYNILDTVNEIMMYLFEDKDSVVINDKLSLIIPELPVRITKSKILSRVNDVMTLYKGDDYNALKYFIYSITNATHIPYSVKEGYGMDYRSKGINTFLDDEIDFFNEIDFDNISSDEYKNVKDKMDYYVGLIKEIGDAVVMYMETINALVCVLITKHKSLNLNPNTVDICANLLDEVMINGMNNDNIPLENGIVRDVYVMLSSLEGEAEKFGPENEYLASALEGIVNCHNNLIEEIGIKDDIEKAKICEKLCSTSYFFELEESMNKDEKVTDEILKKESENLIGKIKDKLDNSSRIEKRAIISLLLTQLPNEFTNSNQIKEYIVNSLEMCSDKAELAGCIGAVNNAIRGF